MDTIKHYRITEPDLALLESELPRILESAAMSCNDALTRKRWAEVKRIVSDVRWDYGPPLEVHQIPAEGEAP